MSRLGSLCPLPRRLLALLVAAAGLGFAFAGEVSAEPAELEALRQQIRQSRERVGVHERQERAVLEELEERDRLASLLRAQRKIEERAAEEARVASIRLESERSLAQIGLERTRGSMSRRVVALYKAGQVGPVRFLFASASMPELLARVSALQTFVEYDAGLLARYRREHVKLLGLEVAAKQAATLRAHSARQLRERVAELDVEADARRRLLARVRGDRSQERALLVELEKAGRALEETVAALGEDAARTREALVGQGFEARRGSLTRPLASAIRLPFGKVVDREFRTETFRKGVGFEASGGESVRAVAPGIVRFAGWFRGYGKLVIVDQGDEYFTVMSHLRDLYVAVGDAVKEGDTLGVVGETGSLTGAGLYFEIRRVSEPEDPVPWFAPAQRAQIEPNAG